jgi:prepilin-type N-terminal cleavage/methylation domain-containing protein
MGKRQGGHAQGHHVPCAEVLSMKNAFSNDRGFTLIEVIIAIFISSLIILGLFRLFSVSLWSYSTQEQLTDMTQNARFTIKEMGDVLMQAGADCSVARDTIIKPQGSVCSACTVKVNPRGGYFQITGPITPATYSLVVTNASSFNPVYAPLFFKAPFDTTVSVSIDTIDSVHQATNCIYFHPAAAFSKNDVVYSFVNNYYYLHGTDFCLNSDANVLAENIETLTLTFLDVNAAQTALWKNMMSVQLVVIARTSLPDARYKGYSDHRRRLRLTYNFRLKNKV